MRSWAGLTATDLIEGSPTALRASATELSNLAARHDQVAHDLQALSRDGWSGGASNLFSVALGDIPSKLTTSVTSFSSASAAVSRFADDLEQAQREAARAIDIHLEGERQTRDWEWTWQRYRTDAIESELNGTTAPRRPSSTDPGQWERTRAEEIVEMARLQVVEGSATLEASCEAAGDTAPDGPGFFSKAWGATKEFFGGAWDATTGMVVFAWEISPIRLMIDPGGWLENVGDMAGGLWWGVQHPVEFFKTAVNWDMWMDNPWRAAGELVPDLIITLATAGGGAAATGARRGADALDAAADVSRTTNRIDDAIENVEDVAEFADDLADAAETAEDITRHADEVADLTSGQTRAIDYADEIPTNAFDQGHLVDRHVGKTPDELLERTVDGPREASSWPDVETARDAVQQVFGEKGDDIQDWLKSAQPGDKENFWVPSEAPGISMTRGSDEILSTNYANVVLKVDDAGDWHVLTGYPTVNPPG